MEKTQLRIAGDAGKSIPRKINFTVAALAAITCPPGRDRVYVYDARSLGLAYCVTANDARSFYLVRKVNRRTQRKRLGDAREISIEIARKLAATDNGKIAQGGDPMAGKRATRGSMTLQELFDRWTKDHAEARLKERTRVTDKSRFDTCFENWKNRKIIDITETDVRALHAQLGRERGHTTANRAVQLLRRLYSWVKIGHTPMGPKAVNLFTEQSRERFVQPDELPKLFAAIEHPETNPLIRDFVKLCLFTGARRANVAAMREEELDIARSTWTVPGLKSKSGKAMPLHLSAEAVAIIKPRTGHESGYIFPSYGKSGHFIEPKSTWAKILERAGLKDLHLHDLRRTLGSFQAALGASLPVIGRSLGHRNTAATQIYARLNLDPVRASVDAATAVMVGAVNAAKKPEETKTKAKAKR